MELEGRSAIVTGGAGGLGGNPGAGGTPGQPGANGTP